MYRPNEERASDRLDRVLTRLSAQPRRQIIVSLLDVPEKRRLPLPDAILTSTKPDTFERFIIELQHHHLPKLAEAGYVEWEADPFSVTRGPHFEEAGAIMQVLLDSTEQLPNTLTNKGIATGYDEVR